MRLMNKAKKDASISRQNNSVNYILLRYTVTISCSKGSMVTLFYSIIDDNCY